MCQVKISFCTNFDGVINIRDEDAITGFGAKLRELRLSKGISQEYLANLAQIPPQQVGRLERGELNVTLSTISVLAKALEIPIAKFFL